MQLLRGLHNPGLETGCVATIGNFDGVHIGHQAIIQQVAAKAKLMGLPSVVVIFEPQPLEYFKGHDAPARLMKFREKFQALQVYQIDYVFCLKFDQRLSRLSASEFIQKVLLDHLGIQHLVVGDDFRFGGDRQGDFALLQESGALHGFSVENTPSQLEQGRRVSSTLVRSALSGGDFALAASMLGREYSILGRVVHGQKLGRTLGFPTANISLHRLTVPLSGVYAVEMKGPDGELCQGVANIGVKPTVGHFKPLLEVHLFDFAEDIYGQSVSIAFKYKVRDEQKFDGLDALKAQIQRDIDVAKHYFAGEKTND